MLTAPVVTVFKFGYTTSSYGPDFDVFSPSHHIHNVSRERHNITATYNMDF